MAGRPWSASVELVPLSTGVRLACLERGDPAGTPLLFLPAYADSHFSYSRVLTALPATVRAIAVDLRGHAGSDKPSCCYAVDDLAADVLALLDALAIPRAALVGHSGSCLVARRVAVLAPERVTSLILIASPWILEARQLRSFVEAVQGLGDPVPREFIRSFQASAAYLPLPRPFLDGLVDASAAVPARVWRDALAGLIAFDDTADLRLLRAPNTLLWGDHDGTVPRSAQDRLVRAIAGSNLIVYPETGHSPHWERPELVAADLGRLAGTG